MLNYKNLLAEKKARMKNVIALGLLVLIGLTFFAVALTDEERQQLELEKAQLESDLSSSGYELNFGGENERI